MTRQAVRRVDRPVSRRARDSLIGLLLVAVLAFAVVGLTTSIAFLVGANLTGSPSQHSEIPNRTNQAAVHHARRRALLILRQARSRARHEQETILSSARWEARHVVSQARARATRIRPHPVVVTNQQAAAPLIAPTPVAASLFPPAAASTAVATTVPVVYRPTRSTGSLVTRIPSTWKVVASGADPSRGTVDLLNRSSYRFSGIVTLTFFTKSGKVIQSQSSRFARIQGNSTTIVGTGPPPVAWYRYHVAVSEVH